MNRCGLKGIPFLFALDFEMTEGIFIENPLEQDEVLFRTPLGKNTNGCEQTVGNDKFLQPFPISYQEYLERFTIVSDGLKRGDTSLVNLTVKTEIETNLSLEQIFRQSDSPYCIFVPDRFVCFSPERFVRIANGVVSANPMKGTINAQIPNAETVLLSDYKETSEHCAIVELLRNDLGKVANAIAVERFRYIDYIKTRQREILQVSSELTGKLPDDYWSRLGDIILCLLPAGSISGSPKDSTIRIIRQAEQESRGFYTGVFGYFDGKEVDSAVLIRYIEKENGKMYFRSGGGITVNSEPEKEYKEVLDKIYLPFL